ncbi:hypothetical protein CIG75_02110 [Tumebacillus algifaecis]|uniref:Fibronectin type-III domain-containing protein n=2 Tax=Tumebacillus algifaecis TaxID=1214604 RepID=A0A223CXG8_9BACL|nr:hypothetical protein CIG75_02110 [Tumebacillus algifaecis]
MCLMGTVEAGCTAANFGKYQTFTVTSISGNTLHLGGEPLDTSTSGAGRYPALMIVQKVPHYTDVTIEATGSLTTNYPVWDNANARITICGGVIFFRATGTVKIDGHITTLDRGPQGARQNVIPLLTPTGSTGAGGAGGGNRFIGGYGSNVSSAYGPSIAIDYYTRLTPGGPGNGTSNGGGSGGGIVVIHADTITLGTNGLIYCGGGLGFSSNNSGGTGGGGGAGGTIWLECRVSNLRNNGLVASGGGGGASITAGNQPSGGESGQVAKGGNGESVTSYAGGAGHAAGGGGGGASYSPARTGISATSGSGANGTNTSLSGGGGAGYIRVNTASTTKPIFTFSPSTWDWESINLAPSVPSNLSPSGTDTTPSLQITLTPTLSWTFNDPDSSAPQKAYQVITTRSSDGAVVDDSGKVISVSSTYTIPSDKLSPGTVYYYSVRVWDNHDAASPSSEVQYFKTANAPSAIPTYGNADSTLPTGGSLTPRLTWSYSDQENHPQAKFEIRIFRTVDNVQIHSSDVILSANTFYDVPSDSLTLGSTYFWQIRVTDSSGMSSDFSNAYYFTTNSPPEPLTIVSPVDTYRTSKRPAFEAMIGIDPENDHQHFRIEIAEDAAFTKDLHVRSTESGQSGWEVKTELGFFAKMPSDGVDQSYTNGIVRYTCQSDLQEGKTYFWRMAPIDASSGTAGAWTAARTIRCGNILAFQKKTPIPTTRAASRIVFSSSFQLPTDGVIPASLRVDVCNNGLDPAPTWEECTQSFLNHQMHTISNRAKTTSNWAVNYRITIEANDSLEAIELNAIGFSFELV